MRKEIEKIPEKIYTIVSYAICSTDKRSDVAYQSSNEICSLIVERLEKLMFKTDKDMQMDDAITLYPLVIKRLQSIIKEIKGE